MPPPFVSVIIPTYNRAKMLGLTIESFIAQDYPKELYEIIISDNNSNDNTRDVVAEWQAKSPVPIKYIFEKRQGVHYARNTAAKIAERDVLYYTDDDMIADPNLLKEIIKPFLMDEKIATVTGRVLPKWEKPPPKWIVALCYNYWLSLNDKKEELIISSADCGIISCHQAILREVFFKSGGFNPENTGGEWLGDGETGLNIKIQDLGYKFAYIGSSIIYHMIPATRMTQSYLNKRFKNQGSCDSYTDYRKYRYTKSQLFIKILEHFVKMLLSCFYTPLSLIGGKSRWRLGIAYIYYFYQRIKYNLRLIKDCEWKEFVLKYNWLDE